jgi:hypothetical protein
MKRVLMALPLLLSACTYWSDDFDRLVDQSTRDFKRDPGKVYKEVAFSDVLEAPTTYKMMDIRFWALMDRRDEGVFAPLYSTFRQEDFFAFSVWPLNSRLWELEERLHSVPTIFIKKDNPDMQAVLDLERYAVIELRGKVTGDFGGFPFIEVHYCTVLEGGPEYEDAAIERMVAGLNAPPAQSVADLEAALQGILGAPARALVHLKLAHVYEDRGTLDKAAAHYGGALKNDPWSEEAKDGLIRTRKAIERKKAIEEGKEPPK